MPSTDSGVKSGEISAPRDAGSRAGAFRSKIGQSKSDPTDFVGSFPGITQECGSAGLAPFVIQLPQCTYPNSSFPISARSTQTPNSG